LLRVLRKVLTEKPSAQSNGSGRIPRMTSTSQVIAVVGAHGGVGSTTLAVNLSCNLATEPDFAVALVDLDLALGDAGVHLAISPHYTIADLSANIDKLDLNFLKRSMVPHEGSKISVLDRPMQIGDLNGIEDAHVERVLNLLKLSYTHLVLDLSKRFTPIDVAALAVADVVLVVTQLELSCVLNTTRILAALNSIENVGERVRLVLNKAGAEEADEEQHRIGAKKAEEIIGKPFAWQIPFDARATNGARSEGVPLSKYAPRSRACMAIQNIAAVLTNKPTVSTTAPIANGGFLRGLFKTKV
jgi:pilus assembly protein CpaE